MRGAVVLAVLALAGCECDPKFKPGDVVLDRLNGERLIVQDTTCKRVSIRGEKRWGQLHQDEVERAP